jgi:hypothetical protein
VSKNRWSKESDLKGRGSTFPNTAVLKWHGFTGCGKTLFLKKPEK